MLGCLLILLYLMERRGTPLSRCFHGLDVSWCGVYLEPLCDHSPSTLGRSGTLLRIVRGWASVGLKAQTMEENAHFFSLATSQRFDFLVHSSQRLHQPWRGQSKPLVRLRLAENPRLSAMIPMPNLLVRQGRSHLQPSISPNTTTKQFFRPSNKTSLLRLRLLR